jgi:hypothetical protein
MSKVTTPSPKPPPQCLLRPRQEYLGIKVGILWFNTGVLIVSTLMLFIALGMILRKQIRMRIS